MGRGATGKDTDWLFSLEFAEVHSVGLAIRPDPERPMKHALVEPIDSMSLDDYRAALSRTRSNWKKVWP